MSYCIKCGKQLDDNSGVCEECQNEEIKIDKTSPLVKIVLKRYELPGKMDCFGVSLAGAIITQLLPAALLLTYILRLYNKYVSSLLLLIVDVLTIVAVIIIGIVSINAYAYNRRKHRAKPVAALTLSIFNLVSSVSLLISWFVVLGEFV